MLIFYRDLHALIKIVAYLYRIFTYTSQIIFDYHFGDDAYKLKIITATHLSSSNDYINIQIKHPVYFISLEISEHYKYKFIILTVV